ncbi:Sulfite exporter TauE/SafE [Chryseobacterium sp. RU37D]|uniref:sulfite exporter TauE/SafE family protein n=1 Tax=Chryseobacterium sp. RU37D TaxID=1907397 RepID=UPI0009547100|nr:sulfite exporter TauE/SafE family protein [Chryseobacterium sp. RU37D]SIQ35740.1 Sulfite exporter TauE/SafE [Chryseobacterium sp. RU37D]
MLTYVEPLWVELIMALFLIGNLPQIFKGKDYKTEEKELRVVNLLTIGLFAGLTSGFISAGGILFNKFYMKIGMTNQQIVATRAANEITLNIVKLSTYIYLGLFTITSFKIGIVVGCAAILSSYLMKKIILRISIKWFYTLGFSTMVISGIVMLINFVEKFYR